MTFASVQTLVSFRRLAGLTVALGLVAAVGCNSSSDAPAEGRTCDDVAADIQAIATTNDLATASDEVRCELAYLYIELFEMDCVPEGALVNEEGESISQEGLETLVAELNCEAVVDVDTNGVDDMDTNGVDDVDTNGVDDMDTNGETPA